jgi:hypothetical protein
MEAQGDRLSSHPDHQENSPASARDSKRVRLLSVSLDTNGPGRTGEQEASMATSKVKPNGIKRVFRIITTDGIVGYSKAENSKIVRARLARDAGAEDARTASVTAIANAGIDGGHVR